MPGCLPGRQGGGAEGVIAGRLRVFKGKTNMVQNPDRLPQPPAGRQAVRFECCFSAVVVTVRRESGVYLTNSWQTRYSIGLVYSAVALLCGPWGVPWGPILTARAVWTNLTGGLPADAPT